MRCVRDETRKRNAHDLPVVVFMLHASMLILVCKYVNISLCIVCSNFVSNFFFLGIFLWVQLKEP